MARNYTKRPPIGKVREAAQNMDPREPFGADDLAQFLGIQDYESKKLLQGGPVYELVKSGELERVSRGRYRWRGKPAGPASAEERLWFTLRKLRRARPEELVELAGISQDYCWERLKAWFLLGVLDVTPDGVWVMLKDSVEMPKDEARAEKCRQWREKQKQTILTALGRADKALQEARLAVSQLGEE